MDSVVQFTSEAKSILYTKSKVGQVVGGRIQNTKQRSDNMKQAMAQKEVYEEKLDP